MMSALLPLLLASKAALASGGGGFHSWTQFVPGFGPDGAVTHIFGPEAFVIATSWIIVGVILFGAVLARRGLDAARAQGGMGQYVPDATLSARNLFEIVIEWLNDLVTTTIEHKDAKVFFPFLATFFFYIAVSNFSGFIPGFLPPTENMSHNFAMAISVFIMFMVAGLFWDAKAFILHLAGPVKLLMVPFFMLETLSLCIRPISLSIRLTVNIYVDHLLQATIRGLGADFGGWLFEPLRYVLGAVAPLPLYFLAALVCVVQAFVFTLLSTIYVNLSLPHGHHDDGHKDGDGHAHAH